MFTFQLSLQDAQLLQRPISDRGKFRTRVRNLKMLKNVEMYLLHVIPFVFGFSEVNLLKSCTVCTSPQIASTGSMRFTFVTNHRNDDTCSIILFTVESCKRLPLWLRLMP